MGFSNMSEKSVNAWKNVKIVAGALAGVGGLLAAAFSIASAVKEFKNGKNTTINVVYPKELFIPQEEPEKAPAISSKKNPEMVKVGEFEGKFENFIITEVPGFVSEKKKSVDTSAQ